MKIEADLSHLHIPVAPKEMLSIGERNSKRLVRINSSSLELIQTCARKAQYSLRDQLRANMASPATLFGSAIHKALETWYLSPREIRTLPSGWSSMAATCISDSYEKRGGAYEDALLAFVEAAEPLNHLPPTDKRSVENGLWILSHYFNKWEKNDPYEVLVRDGEALAEQPVSFIMHEDSEMIIEYFGTIDVVLQDAVTGSVLICDHKTTSSLGKEFMNKIDPNFQYTGYVWAAREALGIDTNEFLVNGIQVKPRPKTSRGTIPDYVRQVTNRDEKDFEELRMAVLDSVNRYLGWLKANAFPMNAPTPCNLYGACQYHPICSASPRLRQNVINAKYQRGNNGEAQGS